MKKEWKISRDSKKIQLLKNLLSTTKQIMQELQGKVVLGGFPFFFFSPKACLHVGGNNPVHREDLMIYETGEAAGTMPLSSREERQALEPAQ